MFQIEYGNHYYFLHVKIKFFEKKNLFRLELFWVPFWLLTSHLHGNISILKLSNYVNLSLYGSESIWVWVQYSSVRYRREKVCKVFIRFEKNFIDIKRKTAIHVQHHVSCEILMLVFTGTATGTSIPSTHKIFK